MNTREYLRQTFELDNLINKQLRHISSLRNLLGSTSAKLSDMPKNPSPSNSRMVDIIAEITDLEKEVDRNTDKLDTIKHTILAASYELDRDGAQRIIELRYVQMLPWEKVMLESGYSKRQVFRFHDEAIEKIKLPI